MKIIFLDIDGVLNTYGQGICPSLELNHKNWDLKLVKRLDWLCEKTSASVVISSSWRKLEADINWWNAQFTLAGAFYIDVVDTTPGSHNGFRGREVSSWLATLPVEKYAILDDDSDFYPSQPRVRTNAFCGLTQGNVWEAYAILMGASKGTGKRCMKEYNP
jgi:hypothetical protein